MTNNKPVTECHRSQPSRPAPIGSIISQYSGHAWSIRSFPMSFAEEQSNRAGDWTTEWECCQPSRPAPFGQQYHNMVDPVVSYKFRFVEEQTNRARRLDDGMLTHGSRSLSENFAGFLAILLQINPVQGRKILTAYMDRRSLSAWPIPRTTITFITSHLSSTPSLSSHLTLIASKGKRS